MPRRVHRRTAIYATMLLPVCMIPVLAGATDRLATPLTTTKGEATRGRDVFVDREGGHCILCHAAPASPIAGNIGPPLQGIGARLDEAQLRQRVVDITQVNPEAAMPAFHRREGLNRVAPAYRHRTLLSAQQVEDVVAYLTTLR